jgi:hypothetical protein
MRNPTPESLPKVLEETLDFTEPFVHFDRLAELGLVKKPGNGGTWRDTFDKYYRFTVISTKNVEPVHKHMIFEDGLRFESLEGSYTNLEKPRKGDVLGLFIWGLIDKIPGTRNIPKRIIKQIKCKGARCLICDTDRNIQCDHKDDDYPYIPPDKLTVSDFQPLCGSCNKEKREAHKKEKNNKKGFYYRDVKDPSKSFIRSHFGLPSDFVFPLLAEETIGKVRFYRNPQLVRELHIKHLRRVIYCQ